MFFRSYVFPEDLPVFEGRDKLILRSLEAVKGKGMLLVVYNTKKVALCFHLVAIIV